MLKKTAAFLFAALIAASSLTACSGSETASGGESQAQEGSQAGTVSSGEAEEVDPNAPYSPVVTYTVARNLGNEVKFLEGESLENNVWSRLYEEKLGIKLEYAWTVPDDQYQQKVSLCIATDDLPDIMPVPYKDFLGLAEEDKLEDITALWDTYASDFVKEMAAQDSASLEHSYYNGKMVAIPTIGKDDLGSANILYVRKDWLDNVGLSEPESIDDVMEIAKAFATEDPDGNGQNDTFGFAMCNEVYNVGLADTIGFFEGMGAHFDIWQENASGDLEYSTIQENMREPLLKLQELYQAGAIDPEFIVKDRWKVGDDIKAGKIGMFYGAGWSSSWCADNKKAFPDAEWVALPLPTADGSNAQIALNDSSTNKSYYVIRKGVEHPEGAIKMLNLASELTSTASPTATQEDFTTYAHVKLDNGETLEVFKYIFIAAASPSDTSAIRTDGVHEVVEQLKAAESDEEYQEILAAQTDTSIAGDADSCMKYYRDGDLAFFGSVFAWDGPSSAFGVTNIYRQNEQAFYNAFNGSPTEGMVENASTLQTKAVEAFTKVITGDDISVFDTFVEEWKLLGGDQITEEVNEWYDNNK